MSANKAEASPLSSHKTKLDQLAYCLPSCQQRCTAFKWSDTSVFVLSTHTHTHTAPSCRSVAKPNKQTNKQTHLRDLRLLWRWRFKSRSSGLWRPVVLL